MNKPFIMSAIGAGAVAAAIVGARTLREGSKNEQTIEDTIKDAGMPGQLKHQDVAQQENAKMVSEGSQFGVQYFNDPDNMPEET